MTQSVPLKRLFSSVRGGSWGSEPGEAETVLTCIRGTDFDYGHLRIDLSRAPQRGYDQSEVRLRAARRGDLIIEKSGGGENQPVGRVVLHDDDELVMPTNFAGRLRPAAHVDARFACYLLASLYSDGRTRAAIKQTTGIQNLDLEALLCTHVPLPRAMEQRRIADYLDAETGRIDALIQVEQRRLDLARERLSSGVQTLVLGGLGSGLHINDPLGPLHPLPSNWTMRRNKTFLREIVDLSETGNEELLTVSHLTGVTPRSEKDVTMFLAETNSGYKRAQKDDLVINTMWAWMGALGVSKYEGIVSPAYGVYRFTESPVEPGYFDALFRSPAYVTEMTRYSKGVWTSRLRLYPESFLALSTPFPPIEEQRSIDHRVRRMTEETEKICALLQGAIDLLIERRKTLITSAVTGQLDISEVAA